MKLCEMVPRHLFVAASAWGGRLITSLVMFVSIRVLMKGIGSEQYAVFSILGGLQGWYMLGDVGLGISLQNHISERRANARDYDDLIRAAAISSLMIFLSIFALLLLLNSTCSLLILKEFTVLDEGQKATIFFVFGLLSLLNCFGSIVYKVWYAEGKGYLANLMPAIGSVLGLVGVLVVLDRFSENKLLWVVVANYLPIAGISFVCLFGRFRSVFKPETVCGHEVFRLLINRAVKFWGFGLMAAATLQVDYLIMSQFLKAYDIVVYNFASKLFTLIFFVYSATLTAVWPVCAECIAKGDVKKVQGYLRNYIGVGTAFVIVATFVLMYAMPLVCRLLSPREQIEVPRYFIAMMGGYFVIRVWADTYAMVLMSMSYIRPFWLIVPFQAVISVLCQWKLGPVYGIYGVVMGLVLSYLCTVTWALPLVFRRKAIEIAGRFAS